MTLEVFQELGLTKSEIKVYLSLLELGQSTTGPIVDKAKIASSKIYEILDKLIQKGLVSYVLKGNIKHFEATRPERILDLLKEKEEILEKQRKDVEKILPELTRKIELSKIKEGAAIYRGLKGLETVFYESLNLMKKGDIMYVIGIPSRSEEINRLFVKIHKFRASKGVIWKGLFNERAKGQLQQNTLENIPLTEIKYMPEGIVTPAAINILNDRIIIFPTTEPPLLIVIHSKAIAESFIEQFDLLWNQQTIVFIGLDGPRYVIKELMNIKGENYAFGLDESKLVKYLPKELNELIDIEEKTRRPVKLIFVEGYKFRSAKTAKVRYLPKSYATPIHYEIYGDKVAMINWDPPITTIITENGAMANSFKVYFNNLWKIAKEK